MKRVVRLTETDLIRIVKRVISENTIPKYDYVFTRNDGSTDYTPAQRLYFITNGDSFDVLAEEYSKDGSEGNRDLTGLKLPKIDELGLTYDMASNMLKNNREANVGNSVAALVTPPMEKGNWVFFINKDGIPTKGLLKAANGLPIKGVLDTKGNGHPLKDNETITGLDYFIVEKPSAKNEYGKGSRISIEELERAKPA